MKKRAENKKRVNWKVLIISLILFYLSGYIGNLFTSQSVNSSWYQNIKPEIAPPNFLFGIVWSVLYLFIALSLYFAWTGIEDHLQKNSLIISFGENLILLTLWSIVFFGINNVGLALFNIILILISICIMIFITWKINRKSSYLLIPYFLWVSFATYLNYLSLLKV